MRLVNHPVLNTMYAMGELEFSVSKHRSHHLQYVSCLPLALASYSCEDIRGGTSELLLLSQLMFREPGHLYHAAICDPLVPLPSTSRFRENLTLSIHVRIFFLRLRIESADMSQHRPLCPRS